jgi:hypothetical protein
MTRVRSATRRSRAPFVTLASRSTMRSRLPRRLMSEIPGQSCRALPACQSSKRARFGNDVVEGKWLDVWPLTDILLTMAMPIPLGLGGVG